MEHRVGSCFAVLNSIGLLAAQVYSTPTPHGTGGSAVIAGDCTAAGAECPGGGIQSALVYVEDNADSGGGADVFQIQYCTGPTALTPNGCGIAEGGVIR